MILRVPALPRTACASVSNTDTPTHSRVLSSGRDAPAVHAAPVMQRLSKYNAKLAVVQIGVLPGAPPGDGGDEALTRPSLNSAL